MQPIWMIRVLFVLTLTLCGYWVGKFDGKGLEFSAIALLLSLFIVALEYATRVLSGKVILLTGLGAFAGLAFSRLFYDTFPPNMLGGQDAARAAFNLFFMYFGIILALRNADRVSLSRLRFFITSPKEDSVLLDTSVIIDGRIKELYELGFITRNPLVPNFVVEELQILSDSSDPQRRHVGRRGLENLENYRDSIPYQLFDKDYPEIQGVDSKLIALAKEIGATILTTDYNLAKVAILHQVRALNINTLSAALRPNLSVGDQLVINITREGKDADQGVGYLEDGTMVVVDDARSYIGNAVTITIISMMQTNSGRLAFGRLLDKESSVKKGKEMGRRDGSSATIEMVSTSD
ncbi:MAG: hypothetical protein JJU11_03685 [Candidatus Sumerlaeia bacterium]|nr:hypothetical protein [Candidatus Sumerlaeia bacterium]